MANETCFLALDYGKAKSETIIRSVLEPRYRCIRTDQSGAPGDFLSEVVKAIGTADLVIADITGHNPSVMYELGLAHAFRRETIAIKCVENLDDLGLPADLLQYKVIGFPNSFDGADRLRVELKRALDAIPNPPGMSEHLATEIAWIESRVGASDRLEDTLTRVFSSSSQPLTAVLLATDPTGNSTARVRAASPEANRFYGYEPGTKKLIDSDLPKLLSHLRTWMDDDDYKAFEKEQIEIGQAAAQGIPKFATVPIRLNNKHPFPALRHRAFLPMVLGVTAPTPEGTTNYTIVLYLDVGGFLDSLAAQYALPARLWDVAAGRARIQGVTLSEFLSNLVDHSPNP